MKSEELSKKEKIVKENGKNITKTASHSPLLNSGRVTFSKGPFNIENYRRVTIQDDILRPDVVLKTIMRKFRKFYLKEFNQ